MDGLKVMAKGVIGVGLLTIWPGPALFSTLTGYDRVGPAQPPVAAPATSDATAWFRGVKPSCNAVEVEVALERDPPPGTWEGRAHEAACLALAGRVDRARAILTGLSADKRWRAAGIVFEAGHPVADAGDDVAAGPLMELVVEFWPNHYMALYHAGAARYALGAHEQARDYLERFLAEYEANDGWRRNAMRMLAAIEG